MTGCTRVDEWIAYRAPTGFYMFTLIGSSPPLKEPGFYVERGRNALFCLSFMNRTGTVWRNMIGRKRMTESFLDVLEFSFLYLVIVENGDIIFIAVVEGS